MIEGIYTLLGGGIINDFSLNVWANNLANTNTPGYLADDVIIRQRNVSDKIFKNIVRPTYIDSLSGLVIDRTITNLKKGKIEMTSNPLDFALTQEEDFFTVSDGNNQFLTRAGNFTLDQDGYLVTQDKKYFVMGQGGKIKIMDVDSLVADNNGRLYIGGNLIDQLLIHRIDEKTQLRKIGDNLIELPTGKAQVNESPQVLQKHLEYSNVDSLKELIKIIQTQRAFENQMNLVRVNDELLDRITNDVAKVAI
jgi:flagellar basal-body rod protein FlgF